MKAKELREMSRDEMTRKELDLKQELFNLRFQHGSGQLENTSRLQSVKRDIARLKTILRQKETQP
jgi:large subunit ribosomal protein L29